MVLGAIYIFNVAPSYLYSPVHQQLHRPTHHIYRPIQLHRKHNNHPDHSDATALFAPPEQWLKSLARKFRYLDAKTEPVTASPEARAQEAYTQLIASMVAGTAYGSAEKSVRIQMGPVKPKFQPFNSTMRENGMDWTYLGTTMTGHLRLRNVQQLLLRVFADKIPGGYMETGVWRGGSSHRARQATASSTMRRVPRSMSKKNKTNAY